MVTVQKLVLQLVDICSLVQQTISRFLAGFVTGRSRFVTGWSYFVAGGSRLSNLATLFFHISGKQETNQSELRKKNLAAFISEQPKESNVEVKRQLCDQCGQADSTRSSLKTHKESKQGDVTLTLKKRCYCFLFVSHYFKGKLFKFEYKLYWDHEPDLQLEFILIKVKPIDKFCIIDIRYLLPINN